MILKNRYEAAINQEKTEIIKGGHNFYRGVLSRNRLLIKIIIDNKPVTLPVCFIAVLLRVY